MRISKSLWILAISLIALLPQAFAQAQQSFSWMYVVGNAAIIAGVLFVLQAFLIPNKHGKELTVVPIIIIIASIAIAWSYGRFGWMWSIGPLARILNIKTIGNAFLIGSVLYFVLGLTVGESLKSNPAKFGLGLLTFVISIFFAMKVGNAWIWEQATVRQFMGYLFGPQGILNPNWGLWTFITSFVLISFFFSNYLFKDGVGKGSTVVNYMLAFVLASNLASSGISMGTVIKLGEVIFVMVFQQALAKTFGENKWLPWVVAIILVGWASYAMTAGTPYEGMVGWVVGKGGPGVAFGAWGILKLILEGLLVIGIYMLLRMMIGGRAPAASAAGGDGGAGGGHGGGGDNPNQPPALTEDTLAQQPDTDGAVTNDGGADTTGGTDTTGPGDGGVTGPALGDLDLGDTTATGTAPTADPAAAAATTPAAASGTAPGATTAPAAKKTKKPTAPKKTGKKAAPQARTGKAGTKTSKTSGSGSRRGATTSKSGTTTISGGKAGRFISAK
jgi:hypothetical protein